MAQINDTMKEKIEKLAKHWLMRTGKESLTDLFSGFDYVEYHYKELPLNIQQQFSRSEFFDVLQAEITKQF